MNQRPAPPKPGPKPGQVKVVRALYKYTAQYPDELSFEEGDILYIQDSESDPDWWKGTCKGRTGLVPSNYVEDNAEVIENPVHDSAKRGNLSFLKECLANKVAVNATDKSGSTPLYCAAHAGHLPCVIELLQCPVVQLSIQNKLGDTALHAAAWKGHAEIVSALLLKGARLDLKNLDGKTPLDLANDPHVRDLLKKASGLSVSNAEASEYIGDDDAADSD